MSPLSRSVSDSTSLVAQHLAAGTDTYALSVTEIAGKSTAISNATDLMRGSDRGSIITQSLGPFVHHRTKRTSKHTSHPPMHNTNTHSNPTYQNIYDSGDTLLSGSHVMPVNSLPQLKTNFAGPLANDSSNEHTGNKITTSNLAEPSTANPIDEQLSNSALPSATNPVSEQVYSQQPAWSGSNITELAAIDSSNDLLYNLHTARQNSQDKKLSSQQYASSSTDITEHSASCLWNEQS